LQEVPLATRQIKRSAHGSNALAPVVRKRIDLDEDFSDVDGDPNSEFVLFDGDGRKVDPKGDGEYRYMWVQDSGDPVAGIPSLARMIPPREVVYYVKGSTPAPRGLETTLKEGDTIKSRDMVLARASRELVEKRERFEGVKYKKWGRPIDAARTSDVNLTDQDSGDIGARERARLGTSSYRQQAQE